MVLSKNKLKKCASNIRESYRNNEKVQTSDLEQINEYRRQHEEIISSVFYDLCNMSKKVHNNSVVVFRLKRIDTRVRKLTRLETGLDRLQDIAGSTTIVDSVAQINSLVDSLENHSLTQLIRKTNSIAHPTTSGYKPYHLVVKKKG